MCYSLPQNILQTQSFPKSVSIYSNLDHSFGYSKLLYLQRYWLQHCELWSLKPLCKMWIFELFRRAGKHYLQKFHKCPCMHTFHGIIHKCGRVEKSMIESNSKGDARPLKQYFHTLSMEVGKIMEDFYLFFGYSKSNPESHTQICNWKKSQSQKVLVQNSTILSKKR